MAYQPGMRLMLTLFTVGVVHGLVGQCGISYAEDDQELAAKLKQIRSEVESAESEISRMKEEFAALFAKRTQLEESVRRIKDDDKAIQKKVLELKDRAVVLASEVAASEKRAIEHQQKIEARLKAIYINTSVSVSPVMARRAARADLERLSLYARKVRDFDTQLFKDASDAMAALMRNRSELDESLAAEEKLREQLKKKRKDAEIEAAKLKNVTDQLVAKQKAAQDSLALLQGEAKKVEAMITSLTSGGEKEMKDGEVKEPATVLGDDKDVSDVKPKEPVMQKTVLHPSLFDTGSKPTAPVKGEVLQTFGRSKLTNFADMVRSKGIEFSTPAGSEVHVVLDGKVVFAGVMPGYDQVIVVEHGGRSYSLYGRLGTVTVKTGDVVDRDQAIATTSNPDAKGRNFYFEVRKNGAPVNPETVLIKVSR